MNWQHIQAFLWLRWRLSVNQWRRGGAINFVLMMILVVAAISLAIPLFLGCVAGGWYGLAEAKPEHLLFVWDVVAVAFLAMWSLGVLTEVQRTENLSMAKFLHLPVSVQGVFAINYVSSLVCLTMVIFAPIMFGLSLGMALAQGPRMLLALPLIVAFLLMVTALTYQLQGWLASLMSNPRRRRAVVVGLTMVFVLIAQLPNLFNLIGPWARRRQAEHEVRLNETMLRLQQEFQAGRIDAAELARRQQDATEAFQREDARELRETLDYWREMTRLANLALPIGWLPLGVMQAADGRLGLAALATLAMTAIGGGSLWRAYRTTLRMYQGQFTAGRSRRAAVIAPAASREGSAKRTWRLLEARLPLLSEPASAVALAGFRSLVRSPEVKMVALTPLLLGLIFGIAGLRHADQVPVSFRPLIVAAGIAFVLFMWMQLLANQFGFDRDGFRTFVLCGAPRRDILLGKNLAVVPLAGTMAAAGLIAFEIIAPLHFSHLLAMPLEFVSMYLLFCILANWVSIYAPVPMAAGSLKPTSVKLWPVFLQMLITMLVLPLLLAPTFVPLGVEPLLEAVGWSVPVPLGLLLAAALCAVVVLIYRACLKWQGELLQAREQKILESVTTRAA